MKRFSVHPKLVLLQIVLAAFFLSVTLSASAQIILDENGWNDTSVGDWDSENRTGTLTTDLIESIEIESDNITLDGNGHFITRDGSLSDKGIYLGVRTGVTVKNVIVQGFAHGIFLLNSSNNWLINNTVSFNDIGIHLWGTSATVNCNNNQLISNTASYCTSTGIWLDKYCRENTLSGNSTEFNGDDGIEINNGSNNNLLIGNSCCYNIDRGIFFQQSCSENTINGNKLNDNYSGILLNNICERNLLIYNTSKNNYYGIEISNCLQASNDIHNNNFLFNNEHTLVTNSSLNNFSPQPDQPIGHGGNHWDDHTTPDSENDGIVDLPYIINMNHRDFFPWVLSHGWPSPPIADAGDDSETIGPIMLDGSQSFDYDGYPFAFFWEIVTKPAGSHAIIDVPTLVYPTLNADVEGYYVISLKVTDDTGRISNPDYVIVSLPDFNLYPIADAGNSLPSVNVGEEVNLDGNNSWDPNGDQLTYIWSFISKPYESVATIENPTAVKPFFIPDKIGNYRVSLVVNDGFLNSDPSIITITAIINEETASDILDETIDIINTFDPNLVFKNKKMGKTLTNKINAVLMKIADGLYIEAVNKLENDILKKTDGCALTGAPDKNDWIRTCPKQEQIYPLIIEAIQLLEANIQ